MLSYRPILGALLALSAAVPATSVAARNGAATLTGGAAPVAAAPVLVAGAKARLNSDGTANAPAGAPAPVVAIIAAANRIATTPYRYGGGHGRFTDSAYDCSGSVSYALHGGSLLESPLASGPLTQWGRSGRGRWVSVFANGGHVYMEVAGLRFDTSGRSQAGTRWQKAKRSSAGFTVRHPPRL